MFNDEVRRSLTPDERAAYDMPAEQREIEQERTARLVDLKFQASVNVLDRYIPESDRKQYDEIKKKIAEIEKTSPRVPQAFAFDSPGLHGQFEFGGDVRDLDLRKGHHETFIGEAQQRLTQRLVGVLV